jgi:hypothetical protein
MWYDVLIFCGMLFSYGQATNALLRNCERFKRRAYYMQPSLLRIMLPDLQDLLVMKKEVTKYSNFPCGPYTVIAQYLVYQESIQEVLPNLSDVLTVDFLCKNQLLLMKLWVFKQFV